MRNFAENYQYAVRHFIRENYVHFFELTLAAAASYDSACAELWRGRSLREVDPAAFDAYASDELARLRSEIEASDDRVY